MLSEKVEIKKPYILGHDNEPDEEDLAIETISDIFDAYEKIHRSHKNVNAFRLEFRFAS